MKHEGKDICFYIKAAIYNPKSKIHASSPAYASSPADKRDYQNTCKAEFQARG